MQPDVLIRGGRLLDGTGAAGKAADLAIRDGRIAAIGTDLAVDAARVSGGVRTSLGKPPRAHRGSAPSLPPRHPSVI